MEYEHFCPRILTIDGGGVRGLSSLLILRQIMDEIGRRNGTPAPLPCEYFEMIGGTSTGGIIAIMLGRLRMVLERLKFWTLLIVVRSRVHRGVHQVLRECVQSGQNR